MPSWLLALIPTIASKVFGWVWKTHTTKRDKERVRRVEEEEPLIPPAPGIAPRELEIRPLKDLPRHPTRKWTKRDVTKLKYICVHHTATDNTKTTWRGISNYCVTPDPKNHLSPEGAPYIPYHFGIDRSGVYQFNDLDEATWSVKGYNSVVISIAILGDFSTEGTHRGKNSPEPIHYEFLSLLIRDLLNKYPGLEIVTHRDLGKWNCPGNVLYDWVKNFKP